jgi:TolB protein
MPDDARLEDIRQVTIGRGAHEHPVFSPDGARLAYYGGAYGSLQIHLVRTDGEEERPLTCGKGNHTQPAFSPDGRHVWYRHQTANDAPWAIERVLVEDPSVREVVLSHPKTSFKHPSPSPDGKTLAWFSDAGTPGSFHLFVAPIRAAGLGEANRITGERDRNDCHPTWSPDGSRLVFHAYLGAVEASESHVFTCTREGGDVVRLTREPAFHKHPFYVGRDLVVHHSEGGNGRRGLALRSAKDGELVGQLTSGKHNDKHPNPFVPERGPVRLAFASKKRGLEIPARDEHNYDVFVGTLAGVRVRR